jgi:hypothetical protein
MKRIPLRKAAARCGMTKDQLRRALFRRFGPRYGYHSQLGYYILAKDLQAWARWFLVRFP